MLELDASIGAGEAPVGSGSTMGEKGEVVAVQKEPQTNLVHLLRLGKR